MLSETKSASGGKNKITFLLIGLLISAFLPSTGKTETLLRWNLLSLEGNKGPYSEMGEQMELLGVDLFFPKYNFGIGSALAEIIELPSNESHFPNGMDLPYLDNGTAVPIHLYYLLYYNKWHLGKLQFANTVNCFAEFWLLYAYPSGSFGIEWSPGTLLKLRAAYTDIFQEHKSAFYVSFGLSLGAINILGGE
ncbi:MAG: hypothetical protein PHX21_03135 [bacterium]|nr:hypothetical protein [bacterium]